MPYPAMPAILPALPILDAYGIPVFDRNFAPLLRTLCLRKKVFAFFNQLKIDPPRTALRLPLRLPPRRLTTLFLCLGICDDCFRKISIYLLGSSLTNSYIISLELYIFSKLLINSSGLLKVAQTLRTLPQTFEYTSSCV